MTYSSFEEIKEDIEEQVDGKGITIVPVEMKAHMGKLSDGVPFVCLCITDTTEKVNYIAMSVDQFETFSKELYDIVTNDPEYRRLASGN